ncbi:hypothetical protein BpHYR1_001082 [Brachionus plicatilis]|uniref:Uncharacterized protein n=1 Tax=Brachionus plicatilis TaxID=10195 RepID=A0A3M7S630_BRAPC|nr:hypothetical protein BpHYR1_001082 [Brachionus plicatilis]
MMYTLIVPLQIRTKNNILATYHSCRKFFSIQKLFIYFNRINRLKMFMKNLNQNLNSFHKFNPFLWKIVSYRLKRLFLDNNNFKTEKTFSKMDNLGYFGMNFDEKCDFCNLDSNLDLNTILFMKKLTTKKKFELIHVGTGMGLI